MNTKEMRSFFFGETTGGGGTPVLTSNVAIVGDHLCWLCKGFLIDSILDDRKL
jgi:hypothetical protein